MSSPPSPRFKIQDGSGGIGTASGETNSATAATSDRISTSADDPIANLLLAHCVPHTNHDTIVPPHLPSIHPGTRKEALHHFHGWVTTSEDKLRSGVVPSRMLWFAGASGTGKTSVLVELARQCQKEDRFLASFFFSARATGRIPEDTVLKRFVVTLAYQIAVNVPGLWDFVAKAVKDDPDILSRSLREQMDRLIFQPLETLRQNSKKTRILWRSLNSWAVKDDGASAAKLQQYRAFNKLYAEWWNRNIIIVGAVDECEGIQLQRDLIALIAGLSRSHPKFPLRFFVSSSHGNNNIPKAFDLARAKDICFRMAIGTQGVDIDVETYLLHELQRIKRDHPLAHISIPADANEWPGRAVLQTLVKKARNLFIYASTAIKVIDNPRQDPVLSLEWILSIPPREEDLKKLGYEQSYAELDALYTAILHPPDVDLGLVRRLLNTIMFSDQTFASTEELDEYLSLSPGPAESALRDLSPIIHMPSMTTSTSTSDPPKDQIYFEHASVLQFLESKERSGDMYQVSPIPKPRFPSRV